MAALEVNLTPQGSLHLAADVARAYFPDDALVALAAGGLLLKQRNARGDRSVLIWEVLPPDTPFGSYPAFWDARSGALRVALGTVEG
jgi:hypothetical protein